MGKRRGPRRKSPEQLNRELFEDRLIEVLKDVRCALEGIEASLVELSDDSYRTRMRR